MISAVFWALQTGPQAIPFSFSPKAFTILYLTCVTKDPLTQHAYTIVRPWRRVSPQTCYISSNMVDGLTCFTGILLDVSTVAFLSICGQCCLTSWRGCGAFQRLPKHGASSPVWHRGGFAVTAPQASAEAYGEQAVNDGVEAGVEKSKDEKDVGEGVRHLSLQVIWEEPVPQTQQVVRSPADYEAEHYDNAHFQSPHPSFGDVVLWAAEIELIWGHWRPKTTRWVGAWRKIKNGQQNGLFLLPLSGLTWCLL